VRVRGTRFFGDPAGTMDRVVAELGKLGVRPRDTSVEIPTLEELAAANRERVVGRALEIMREQGWLPQASLEVVASGR
jgi:hypothetical protein